MPAPASAAATATGGEGCAAAGTLTIFPMAEPYGALDIDPLEQWVREMLVAASAEAATAAAFATHALMHGAAFASSPPPPRRAASASLGIMPTRGSERPARRRRPSLRPCPENSAARSRQGTRAHAVVEYTCSRRFL